MTKRDFPEFRRTIRSAVLFLKGKATPSDAIWVIAANLLPCVGENNAIDEIVAALRQARFHCRDGTPPEMILALEDCFGWVDQAEVFDESLADRVIDRLEAEGVDFYIFAP